MKIKKGEKVMVITGHEKGKEGVVTKAFPKEEKVIVEGLNMVTKHNKPNQQNTEGTITKQEAPIHVSNVMILDPKTKKRTRIAKQIDKDGKKIRVSSKSKNKLD